MIVPLPPVDSAQKVGQFPRMSTLAEIEEAIEKLPPEQWAEIRRWMDVHEPKQGNGAGEKRVDWSKSAALTHSRDKGRVLSAEEVGGLFEELRG